MRILIAFIALLFCCNINAQLMFTKEGTVHFESIAPLETIHAVNHNGNSVIDLSSGKVEYAVLIKAFKFKKALMQQHFNENYMDSSKYPKAVFKGNLKDINQVNFKVDGKYEVIARGDLTIHGVTREVDASIEFVVEGEKLSGASSFEVDTEDYKIEIPKLVKDNIAKSIKIDVYANYELFKRS